MRLVPRSSGLRRLLGAGLLLFAATTAGAKTPREQGKALYYRGRLTEAARFYEKAVRAAPRAVLSYLDAAVVYRDLGAHARSRRLLKSAAELRPGDADIQAALGWAAMRTGRLSEARAAFAAAHRIDAAHPWAAVGSAHLDLRMHRPQAALKTLEALLRRRPDVTVAHVLKARAYEMAGQKKSAVSAYKKAYLSDPTYTEVRLWLGPLYKKLRKFNEAWRQYTKILNVDPRYAPARRQRSKLRRRLTRRPKDIIPARRQKRHLPVVAAKGSKRMPIIRVAIGTTAAGRPAVKKRISFVANGPFEIFDPETGKKLLYGPAKKAWFVRRIRKGRGYAYELRDHKRKKRLTFSRVIAVKPRNTRKHSIIFQRLELAEGTTWEAQGDRQIKGIVEIRALGARGLYLVNQLPLEDYIYGVINEEMPSSFPEEALKAQAVIARNHALISKRIHRKHKRYHYDLCDGQHCQVYSGVSGETARGRRAVDVTRGLVLRYKGRLAQTPYSSNCGGHTQNSGEITNWADEPYLLGSKDTLKGGVDKKSPWELDLWLKTRPKVYCNVPKYMHASQFRWSRIINADDLGDRLRRRTKRFGLLRKIFVTRRSASGNVNKLEFRGTRGRFVVNQEQRIRGILGLGSVRSTMFTMEIDRNSKGVPTDIFLYGGGWGHGAGLCQLGAAGRGMSGQTYQEILAHYFPKTEIKSLGY